MGDEEVAREFARDIVLLEQTAINPVVVHGGGPQIEAMLKRARHQVAIRRRPAHHRRRDRRNRRDGAGRLDQQADRRLHQRRRRQGHRPVRQGRQHGDRQEGDAHAWSIRIPTSRRWSILASSASRTRSTPTVLDQVLGRDLIPVLAPVAASADGGTFNVNADTFAGAIAGALKAKRLLLLTDVPGVLDKSKKLIKELSRQRCAQADRRRHDFRRHDPQGRDLHLCAGTGRRGRRDPRRQDAARRAARTVHRSRRRHADPIADGGRQNLLWATFGAFWWSEAVSAD